MERSTAQRNGGGLERASSVVGGSAVCSGRAGTLRERGTGLGEYRENEERRLWPGAQEGHWGDTYQSDLQSFLLAPPLTLLVRSPQGR